MKTIYSFFLLFFIQTSCELSPPSPINISVDILGVLKVDHVAEVSLKKIFQLGEPIDRTNLDIMDAKLLLMENNVFFDSLTCNPDKVYRTTKILKPNSKYLLKGTLQSGHQFYSHEITTPPRLKPINVEFFSEVQNPFSSSIEPVAKIKFDWTKLESDNFFLGVRPNPDISGENPQIESNLFREIINQNSDCIVSSVPNFLSNNYQIFFRKSCIESNNSSFWIEKSLFKVISTSPNFQVEKVNLNQFLVSYGIVSDELYLYLKGSNPIGIERMSIDPSLSYTNIIGAQGVIFGKSEIQVILP